MENNTATVQTAAFGIGDRVKFTCSPHIYQEHQTLFDILLGHVFIVRAIHHADDFEVFWYNLDPEDPDNHADLHFPQLYFRESILELISATSTSFVDISDTEFSDLIFGGAKDV